MPTSISGYSICATQGDSIDEELNGDTSNEARNNNNYVQDQLTAFTNSARQHQKLRQSVIYSEKHDTTQFPLSQSQTTSTSGSNSRAGMATSASNYSMSSGINLVLIQVWFNYLQNPSVEPYVVFTSFCNEKNSCYVSNLSYNAFITKSYKHSWKETNEK